MKDNFGLSEEKNIQTLYSGSKLHTRLSIWDQYGTSGVKFNQWIFDQITPFLGESIVDIGCGTGRMGKMLFEAGRKGNYTGLDVSQDMLQQTRTNLQPYLNNVELLFGNIEKELYQGQYEVITGIHLLHHAGDVRKMLSNIKRLGKQGSKFFFTCSNMNINAGLNGIHYEAIESLGLPDEMKNTNYLFFQTEILYNILKDVFLEVQEDAFENGFNCSDIALVMKYYNSSMKYRGLADIETPGDHENMLDRLEMYVSKKVQSEIDKTGSFFHPANVTLYICTR